MSDRTPYKKASTLDGREQQNIALAVDLAEKQLREGSAPAAVVTHYLKLATEERKLEQLKIMQEIETMKAKAEQARSNANMEEMYKKAIAAFREYQGLGPQEVDPNEYPLVDDPTYFNPGGEPFA